MSRFGIQDVVMFTLSEKLLPDSAHTFMLIDRSLSESTHMIQIGKIVSNNAIGVHEKLLSLWLAGKDEASYKI